MPSRYIPCLYSHPPPLSDCPLSSAYGSPWPGHVAHHPLDSGENLSFPGPLDTAPTAPVGFFGCIFVCLHNTLFTSLEIA